MANIIVQGFLAGEKIVTQGYTSSTQAPSTYNFQVAFDPVQRGSAVLDLVTDTQFVVKVPYVETVTF